MCLLRLPASFPSSSIHTLVLSNQTSTVALDASPFISRLGSGTAASFLGATLPLGSSHLPGTPLLKALQHANTGHPDARGPVLAAAVLS